MNCKINIPAIIYFNKHIARNNIKDEEKENNKGKFVTKSLIEV